MTIKSLQVIALQNLKIIQAMKAEKHEKEVLSRIFIQAVQANDPLRRSHLRMSMDMADDHPCRMSEFRVWHGNWKMLKDGSRVERNPLKFRGRSTCRCICNSAGNVCECSCVAIIKMAAEHKMRSNFVDSREPIRKFRIVADMRIVDIFPQLGLN